MNTDYLQDPAISHRLQDLQISKLSVITLPEEGDGSAALQV